MEFLRARPAVLVIVLVLFLSEGISGGLSADAICKNYPECGNGAVCKKRTCENCKKLWHCSCEKDAYHHSYYNSSVLQRSCAKTCKRIISCQSNTRCFVPCKKDHASICECALRNKNGLCLEGWQYYSARICPQECEKRCRPGRECFFRCHCYKTRWKEKCIPPSPSPSSSPSPSASPSISPSSSPSTSSSPSATASTSISPSTSPSPLPSLSDPPSISPSPMKILASLKSKELSLVSGKTLSISLTSSGVSIGDKVTISNFLLTGGTMFRIDLNEEESVLTYILSGVKCSFNLNPLPLPMAVNITVKDIGNGMPGVLYEATGEPFGDSCKVSEFKFSVAQ